MSKLQEKIKFTIPLAPITKKNHQQIFTNRKTGKPFITQSTAYKSYENAAGWFMSPLGINYPVNVKAIYYIDKDRKVDICGDFRDQPPQCTP